VAPGDRFASVRDSSPVSSMPRVEDFLSERLERSVTSATGGNTSTEISASCQSW
jgi:hypothetical protein